MAAGGLKHAADMTGSARGNLAVRKVSAWLHLGWTVALITAGCGKTGYGEACADDQACQSGICVVTCQSGLTNCSGTCANLSSDNANCGTCNHACQAGTGCHSGICS